MTVRTLMAAAPGLDLPGGAYIRLEAIDSDTGAAVTGVSVTQVAVYGRPMDSGADDFLIVGTGRLIPGPGA